MGWFSELISGKSNPEGRLTVYDVERNKERWQWIEDQMKLGRPTNLKLAILEADKIVDESLKAIFPGQEKMADRLKLAQPKFRNREVYEDLWYGHKVRNTIAHEISYDLPTFEAQNILVKFRAALQELGAL